MQSVRRLLLVRHGETDGQSSVRYFGSTDVPLSDHGRAQIRQLASTLRGDSYDAIVSSPLSRAWHSAWILAAGRPVQLEHDLREIHFGRWEGLTREEIEARDPVAGKDWEAGAEGFEYPGGEPRAEFAARVRNALGRILQLPARSVLVVTHKGVIRTIVKDLTGETMDRDLPPLGGRVTVVRQPGGAWWLGTRGSNPPGVVTPGRAA